MEQRQTRLWLVAFAIAYAVLHHNGTVLSPLGGRGTTRWIDWFDLATPLLVLLPSAGLLRCVGGNAKQWVLWCVGAIVYTEGHGVHLAANSIYHDAPSDTAHLWDEVVGHLIWYSGFWIIVVVLVAALAKTSLPLSPLGVALAAAVGVTHATNGLGADRPVPVVAAVIAVAFIALGLRLRTDAGRYLAVAYAIAILTMTAVLLVDN
ncbi:MAG: hypothetical protein ABI658_03710 [Acidimicrobiales bacterium]